MYLGQHFREVGDGWKIFCFAWKIFDCGWKIGWKIFRSQVYLPAFIVFTSECCADSGRYGSFFRVQSYNACNSFASFREVNEIFSNEFKCSIYSGSSASLIWSFSAWLSSFRSMLTTTGRRNLMFSTWLVEFILGTTNPLTNSISAENQWV